MTESKNDVRYPPFLDRELLEKIANFAPPTDGSPSFVLTPRPGCELTTAELAVVHDWVTTVLGGEENLQRLAESPPIALVGCHLLTYLVLVGTERVMSYSQYHALPDGGLPPAVAHLGGLQFLHQVEAFRFDLERHAVYVKLHSGVTELADEALAEWFIRFRPADWFLAETTGDYVSRWQDAANRTVKELQRATFDAYLAEVLDLEGGAEASGTEHEEDQRDAIVAGVQGQCFSI